MEIHVANINNQPYSFRTPVLKTKLVIPHTHADFISRSYLIEKLNEGLKKKLILVSAPAGFGKTTAVTDWSKQTGLKAGWIALERGDNQPVRFWDYLLAALDMIQPGLGLRSRDLLHPVHLPPRDSWIMSLIHEINSFKQEFVLVLDDYHVIKAADIHERLQFLIEHIPVHMHLVIITRSDPPFPLHRWRLHNELLELRTEDLRFIGRDFIQFFNQQKNIHLTSQDIATLKLLTEGWVTGMKLTALSMKGRDSLSPFIQNLSGNNRYIYQYLTEEVFNGHPEPVQKFLLQTSILDRLTPSLCDAVTGQQNTKNILEELYRSNSFIVALDEEQQWYRYHHLMSDVLKHRLQQKHHELIPKLHLSASEWFEKHGYPMEAVEHALAAANYEKATNLMDKFAPLMLKNREISTLFHWLNAFPPQWIENHPGLCIVKAWVLALTDELDHAEAILHLVENKLTQSNEEDHGLWIEMNVLRGYIAILKKETDRAAELMERSTQRLPKFSRFFQTGVDLNAGEAYVLRSRLGINGYLKKVEKLYTKLRTVWKNSGLPIVGYGSVVMAELYYEWNKFDEVMYFIKRGIELGANNQNIGILVPIYLTYARLKRAESDRTEMWLIVAELAEIARQFDSSPHWARIVSAFEIRLCIEEADYDKVADWFGNCGLNIDDHLTAVREFEFVTFARALLFLGKADDAIYLLNRLLKEAEMKDRFGSIIEILILKSLAFKKKDDIPKATLTIDRALSLAAPEGYIRTFIDEGKEMAELLHLLVNDKKSNVMEFALTLLAEFGIGPSLNKMVPPPLVENLTSRELELLEHIEIGLTNKEIAEHLHISVGTVKGYLNKIFAKLNVKNRTQAITRAREMSLLKEKNEQT